MYTSPYFTKLPIWDRLTALPLIGPLLEVDSSEEAYRHYDQLSALELFQKKGVSQRLIRQDTISQLLQPLLLIYALNCCNIMAVYVNRYMQFGVGHSKFVQVAQGTIDVINAL